MNLKQKMYQQFVYKVNSSRILRAKERNLVITPKEARLSGEIISLADSAVLRMIDRLNGVNREKVGKQIKTIRSEIKSLKQHTNDRAAAKRKLRELYSLLDEIQIKSDYINVVMDRSSDFDKLNEGFCINGTQYQRLVGTVNGVKKSTIVYAPVVNSNGVYMHEELSRRMNGEWKSEKEIVLAKYEAYKSLACSASTPVSFPHDVLVVDDLVLSLDSKIIQLKSNDEGDEPIMEEKIDCIDLNASDGFGLMCPAIAKRWSEELGLGYTASGMCLRNLFCKGMVFTFDFHEFAKRYAKDKTVADIWGNTHNIGEVELILPVSVMKLWDNYNSYSHYIEVCKRNWHTFAVTKVCENKLENERTLNYQFVQSYDFSDEEIWELVSPTISEIKGIISGDIDRKILFLKGSVSEKYDFDKDDNHLAKALMVNPCAADDPYIISVIHNMIRKKIDDLKIGVLKVHGNYTVISGDPFAFCQKIFGCDVPDSEKGLLKAGEMYSRYWIDENGGNNNRVVCFRAPMSCHNNIRVMNVVHNDKIDFWYKYMRTVNIINVHDTFYPAMNGADNDGDSILTTDNSLLLKKTCSVPAIMCVQKKAEKSVVTEERLRSANKNSFGDEIGAITNRVTSMYDVITRFKRESQQYEILEYRIKCGQLLQQDCIDRSKGIISKPMPKTWYDIHSVKSCEEDDEETAKAKLFNKSIIADKKPYFMIYIYPQLRREYNRFVNAARSKCEMKFGVSLDDLLISENRGDEENEFIQWYYKRLPVTDGGGVMNRMCHIVEREFEGYVQSVKDNAFSYGLYLSDDNLKVVCPEVFGEIKGLYEQYTLKMKEISVDSAMQRRCESDIILKKASLTDAFQRECAAICPNSEQLCDILLNLCYVNTKSKKFVWDMCGEQIVRNLLKRSDGYSYYVLDDEGLIGYKGKKYRKVHKRF